MFIFTYLTIFVSLYCNQAPVVQTANTAGASDAGWGLFLSVSQGNHGQFPSYDIGHWTRQLHLQQCAFVEIGEEFCALFVELRSIPSTKSIADSSGASEFFLGLCKCATVRSWILCSDQLMLLRKSDCMFTEAVPSANTSARVHRRLCDITLLTEYAEPCNCSVKMANQQLYRTKGFPTCFRAPLPESICLPRGVCGIGRCCATTIKGIHSPQCDPECHERQPFCEELGPWTSIAPEITSLWSHWSTPVCQISDGRVFSTATAMCQNQMTREPAIDCIGPGSFCCPTDAERCTCIVTTENGTLKATRIIESTPRISHFKRNSSDSIENTHPKQKENDDEEHVEEGHSYPDIMEESMEYLTNLGHEDIINPLRRQLMAWTYDYLENFDRSRDGDLEFAGANSLAADDPTDDNDDDENDEDEDDEEDDAADEEENVDKDDDGELAENDEEDPDSTDSSEHDEYEWRGQIGNMKMTGMQWTNKLSGRFVRNNPLMSAGVEKRDSEPNGEDNEKNRAKGDEEPKGEEEDEEEVEEAESSGYTDEPLVYSDYDTEQPDAETNTGDEYDEDVSERADSSSLRIIGKILKPHPFRHFSTYVYFAALYLI